MGVEALIQSDSPPRVGSSRIGLRLECRGGSQRNNCCCFEAPFFGFSKLEFITKIGGSERLLSNMA